MAQDDAPKPQVGLHVKQLGGVAVTDQAGPERHDLHVAPRADRTDGVFPEPALDLYQSKHERRLQPGPLGLVPERLEKFDAGACFALAPLQALAGRAKPAQVDEPLLDVGKTGPGGRIGRNRGRQRRAHRIGQRLLDLRAGQ